MPLLPARQSNVVETPFVPRNQNAFTGNALRFACECAIPPPGSSLNNSESRIRSKRMAFSNFSSSCGVISELVLGA
jgi:hypothetical protein